MGNITIRTSTSTTNVHYNDMQIYALLIHVTKTNLNDAVIGVQNVSTLFPFAPILYFNNLNIFWITQHVKSILGNFEKGQYLLNGRLSDFWENGNKSMPPPQQD